MGPFTTPVTLNLMLFNVLSGICRTRFWISAFSKRVCCQCGCKGRCTFDSFWRILVWAMTCWMSGDHPVVRDDGIRFDQSKWRGDKRRAQRARVGKKMHTRGGVMQKRSDWCWLKQVDNLCGWSGEGVMKRCCFKCSASVLDVLYCAGLSKHAPSRTQN